MLPNGSSVTFISIIANSQNISEIAPRITHSLTTHTHTHTLTRLLILSLTQTCTLNKTITTSLAVKRCSGPPAVANTTWSVDKKSFEQRVIYKCLPRFHLVSGELAKVCSSDLKWTGEDPVCVGACHSVQYTSTIKYLVLETLVVIVTNLSPTYWQSVRSFKNNSCQASSQC